MSLLLPRPPEPALIEKNPREYARQMHSFLSRLIAEIERDSRDTLTPAKAVFTLTNNAAPVTALDVNGATLGDVRNFLGGTIDSLLAKGILRSKAADP